MPAPAPAQVMPHRTLCCDGAARALMAAVHPPQPAGEGGIIPGTSLFTCACIACWAGGLLAALGGQGRVHAASHLYNCTYPPNIQAMPGVETSCASAPPAHLICHPLLMVSPVMNEGHRGGCIACVPRWGGGGLVPVIGQIGNFCVCLLRSFIRFNNIWIVSSAALV